MDVLEDTIFTLASQFEASFPERVPALRTVGREAEFPIVTPTGEAADVRWLWDVLMANDDLREHYDSGTANLIVGLEGEDYSYELEVGVGTIEIVTRPCHSLHDIEQLMERAVRRLVQATSMRGWQVLSYGIQPVSRPTLNLMAPKQRYQSLYRAMGAEWLWYTLTASDQCHVAIGRPELVQMLNFGNLMAPVLIALCANSPVYNGRISPFCSGREGQMAFIQANEFRHGMPPHPFADIADYIRTISQWTHLIARSDGEVIPTSQSFLEYLRANGPDFEAFLFHEHYVWNSARLRTTYGTLEIRPACQQPWDEHMAAMALSVGLIQAIEPIMAYVQEELGEDYWSSMRTYHSQVIKYGLAAPQPVHNFLKTVIGYAEWGLQQRNQGEEQLLGPIHLRLVQGQNPAQRVRNIYQLDGMRGVLAHTAIRPGSIHMRRA